MLGGESGVVREELLLDDIQTGEVLLFVGGYRGGIL